MRTVTAVANLFIQLAQAKQIRLTGSQLNALLYLAHGMRLAQLNKPLLDQPVLASRDGVSFAALNAAGLRQGRPVDDLIGTIVQSDDGNELREQVRTLRADDPMRPLVKQAWTRYGNRSSYELTERVRSPGGPWDEIWNNPLRLSGGLETAPSGLRDEESGSELAAVIPDALIRRWFRKKMIEDQRRRALADGLERTMDISGKALEETIQAKLEPELRSR